MNEPDPVRAQYEALPYPPRDPREEDRRLVLGSPSHLAEVDHFVFGGRLDPRRPLRVLVAGGGTGDATVMLAQQLADRGFAQAEIVYLDPSAAAGKIAEARVARRRLANVRFLTAALGDLPNLGLGPFDYIDCCGVLHHLEDPAAALSLLTEALAPSGGMGLMVYGELGRTGVYPMQDALRAIAGEETDHPARLALARRLLAQLPVTNWLKRNPFVSDHLTAGDAGLFDLLLHARDRAYRVPEIVDLVDGAGLRVVAFVPPARYRPASYLSDAALLKRMEALPPFVQAAIAENIAGNIKAHVVYVVPWDNAIEPPSFDDPEVVPVPFDADISALARGLRPGGVMTVAAEGLNLRFALPRLGPVMAELIDGKRTLGAIHEAVANRAGALTWTEFAAQFARLFAALHGAGKLYLHRPAPR